MTIFGTLLVVWYSMQPWLWLIALMLAVLLLVQFIARMRGYKFNVSGGKGAFILPLVIMLIAIWAIPWHTQSHLVYVSTWVDWLNLIAATLGLGMYSWLVLHPVCYLKNSK